MTNNIDAQFAEHPPEEGQKPQQWLIPSIHHGANNTTKTSIHAGKTGNQSRYKEANSNPESIYPANTSVNKKSIDDNGESASIEVSNHSNLKRAQRFTALSVAFGTVTTVAVGIEIFAPNNVAFGVAIISGFASVTFRGVSKDAQEDHERDQARQQKQEQAQKPSLYNLSQK